MIATTVLLALLMGLDGEANLSENDRKYVFRDLRVVLCYDKQKEITDVDCINDDILADFLKNHRAEVMDVCITEYNEKTFVDGIRAEGYDEGHAEGHDEGRLEAIRNMIKYGVSKEIILQDYSEEEYQKAEQQLLVNA